MDLSLLYAILFTLAPITELRIGLPIAINFALKNNISVIFIFFFIVLINILLIFFIFFFLDRIHKFLMRLKIYRKSFEFYLDKIQKKVDKFEKRYNEVGFFALMLFVAIPLPGTGAWSGCLLSWILGLERKKSIIAIALGVTIAGLIILLGTLGVISLI